MNRDDTLRVRNIDTGQEADLIRFTPGVKEEITVSQDGAEKSVFVLDWEPVEGHRQSMYEWLSEKEDVLAGMV